MTALYTDLRMIEALDLDFDDDSELLVQVTTNSQSSSCVNKRRVLLTRGVLLASLTSFCVLVATCFSRSWDNSRDALQIATSGTARSPACAAEGGNCLQSRCCTDPALKCFEKNGVGASCEKSCNASTSNRTGWSCKELTVVDDFDGVEFMRRFSDPSSCSSRFVAPGQPVLATDHNGVMLPDVCFTGAGPHHVFVLGDWGGILPGGEGNEHGDHVTPADHTTFGEHQRSFVHGVDDWAQQRVAEQFRDRAKYQNPDYILNLGDSFYWGGVSTHCGAGLRTCNTAQFASVFESVYTGPGLDGKQWLGVLGNHDYGGFKFTGGWDQTIGYTWGGTGSSGRWMMPAQYWRVKVKYDEFSVDYFFLDTNVFDAHAPDDTRGSNICSLAHNGGGASCGATGPASPWDCQAWFNKLWNAQKPWLHDALDSSYADWQIVVTHFPPSWGHAEWAETAKWFGVDIIISGHKHAMEVHYISDKKYEYWPGLPEDFLSPTAWIVAGGGGGVTSEDYPAPDGSDDQYGFVDLTLTRQKITIEQISHTGQVHATYEVTPRPHAVPTDRGGIAYKGISLPVQETRTISDFFVPPGGAVGTHSLRTCEGYKPVTFYMYRAQNDENQYSDENINAASLAGVLWYLHHEVVMVSPRKFGISRIRRLKVTMTNTCDLFSKDKTMFGPYDAFDRGKCHAADCTNTFNEFGFTVGCQHIPYNVGMWGAYCKPPFCHYAHWYSLPGKCPEAEFSGKTAECIGRSPGGACMNVNGARDCTYHTEDAGDVRLDELYTSNGRLEYNNQTDSGDGVTFWEGIYDPSKCKWRYDFVLAQFKAKYPDMPPDLPEPRCDQYSSDPKDFFHRTGSGFHRPTSY